MLKIVEVLSRSTRVALFSLLLGLSWIYQNDLSELLGLTFQPWINRFIQLLLVSVTAYGIGTPANCLFSKIHEHLERRRFNDSPPGL